jgi:3-hydroxy-9,10-secoandrosta-1,3,5(10)-triene-9,17-dione monooxygenase reductase component
VQPGPQPRQAGQATYEAPRQIVKAALRAALSDHFTDVTDAGDNQDGATTAGQAAFRAAMANLPTGVSLLTTAHDAGIWGMTVGSLTSLSLSPPLLLVCLHRASTTLDLLAKHGRFAVNVLSDAHEALAEAYAHPRDPTAAAVGTFEDVDGVPVLSDAVACFTCRHEQTYTSGDHAIVIGAVIRSCHAGRDPLVRHQSRYRRLQ